MEKPLEKILEDLMKTPGINGVQCVNSQGLGLGAKGVAVGQSAGVISRLTEQASQLHPEANQPPVIVIESDVQSVLIKQEGDVSMAIFKSSS